jgi:hypothetical protein
MLQKVAGALMLAGVMGFLGWAAFRSAPSDHIGRASWFGNPLPSELSPYLDEGAPWLRMDGPGCCLDSVARTQWEADGVSLEFSAHRLTPLKIFLAPTAGKPVLQQGLTSFAIGHGHLWAVDQARGRFLDYSAAAGFQILPGSEDLGSAQAVVATPFQYRLAGQVGDPTDGDRLLLTSHSRLQQAVYAISPTRAATGASTSAGGYTIQSPPSDARSLAEYRPDLRGIRPVLEGLELYGPTGMALSPGGDRLYVADERPSELVWLELRLEDFCRSKWNYQGVLARFPLKVAERSLFRGLTVHSSGIIVGSAPGGLFFYAPDGRQIGEIATTDEITHVIPGFRESDPKMRLQPDRIYAAVGSRLCYLPMKALGLKKVSPQASCAPLKPKLPKIRRAPQPDPKCCCCKGTNGAS